MWIRTECGIITNKFKFATEDKTIIKLVEDGLVDSRIFFVKKQGDNLIDVLEVGDIITTTTNYTVVISNIREDKSAVICDYNERSSSIIFPRIIEKVITHEQYMPLAQEVK